MKKIFRAGISAILLAGMVLSTVSCGQQTASGPVPLSSSGSGKSVDSSAQEASAAEEVGADEIMSAELPNGWQTKDFTIAGFDKEGPGNLATAPLWAGGSGRSCSRCWMWRAGRS